MAKYNYDKKALKGLTPFPFLGEVKTRTAAIEAAPATLPKSVYNPNILAKRLHPAVQHCLIQKVEDHGDAKSFTLVPDAAKGTKEMAYFRASQYVSVALNIDGAPVHKPYTIRSNPKDGGNELYAHRQADQSRLRLRLDPGELEGRRRSGYLRPPGRLLLSGSARREAGHRHCGWLRYHTLLFHGGCHRRRH